IVAASAPLASADATVRDTVRAAIDLCALVDGDEVTAVERTLVMGEPDPTDEAKGGGSDPGEEVGGEPSEVDAPGSVDKEDRGADASDLGGQATDVFAHERQPEVDESELSRDGRTIAARLPPITDADGARIYLYDEWDYLAGRHLPAWCRVVERRLVGDDFGFIGDVRRRYAVLASRLRRQFAHIRPEGWVRVHRSDDGDELDFDAVIEAIVDRRTGHAANERLHVRRDRAERDVATAFLVDLSASTGSAIPDPDEIAAAAAAAALAESNEQEYRFAGVDPWETDQPNVLRRRVLDIAKESVAMMCDALQLLGDRHAVYGFSGEGRGRVEFHVAKEFDDRTSPASWAALAAMQPRRYTRMGPAIRHATAKIAAQPTRTKLLIVISDGYPQDIDYGPNRGDKEYGLQDTARALQDAAAAGIATFCVTIDPAGHDYLRRMCADQSYLVIDDVPSLPRELAKLYGTLAVPTSRRTRRVDP
ncbi:MAG: VWA domain-containing protein, partial [Ilumatobacteraceae bacterium]